METIYKNIHQDIIDRCRGGDSSAQFQLYKLYYKAMYNTSLRILKDEAEAEDIMQESFLTAFGKMDSYKGESTFGAWLKRIVVNNSINALNKRKEMVNFDDAGELLKEYETGSEADGDEPEYNMKKVYDTIKELPDGYRTILSLYLLEGYDHEEISEILNISSATSRSQFNRAKMKLRKLLIESKWQSN